MGLPTRLLRHERTILSCLTRAFVPSGGPIELDAGGADLTGRVERAFGSWSPRSRLNVRMMLWGLELVPFVLGERRPLTRLSPEAQARAVRGAYRHRWRLVRFAATSAKQISYANFISHPDVEAAIGYTYDCLRPLGAAGPDEPGEQVHR